MPIQSRGAAASTYNPSATSQSHQHSASPAPLPHSASYSHKPPNYSQSHISNASLGNQHLSRYDPHSAPQTSARQSSSNTSVPVTNINGPKASDVWTLGEHANAAIPSDIREQFQCDDKGRVLFFTTPPIDTEQSPKLEAPVGHSAKYLAHRLRREMALREKRKAAGVPEEGEDPDAQHLTKKPKVTLAATTSDEEFQREVVDLKEKAIDIWVKQMTSGTEAIYQNIYGADWDDGFKMQKQRLAKIQEDARRKQAELRASEAKRRERAKVAWSTDVYLDDWGTMF